MIHLLYQLSLVPLSAIGAATYWWLWREGVPERYVLLRVPEALDGPITLDSDYRGLAR